VDLAITTFELWPQKRQRLLIYRNESPETGSWIGYKFLQHPGGKNPINARIQVETPKGRQTRWITTGDSYRSQASASVHFGLGRDAAVLSANVYWADGTTTVLPKSPANRWYRVE